MTEDKAEDKATRKRTPTESLIAALEHADEMEEVMIIFRLTKDGDGKSGMGWVTERPSLPEKLAFIEEAKMAMFHNSYEKEGGA